MKEGERMLLGKKSRPEIEVPVGFVDLHCHILAGVDDGAKDDEQMFDLIRLEYDCGVRHLCFTPHYNPALFPPKPKTIAESFEKAKDFVSQNLPDMTVYLGNEVFIRPDTVERLRDHSCKALGNTRTVLCEFHPSTSYDDIRQTAVKLMSAGKLPLFAHIERYDKLNSMDQIMELKGLGVKMQVNTEAFSCAKKKLIFKLTDEGVIDAVADDRHSRERGEPNLKETYRFVAEKFGNHAAQALFIYRPASILNINVEE